MPNPDAMILLLRHGQTDWNVGPARCQGWAEVPLDEAGDLARRIESFLLGKAQAATPGG